MMVYVYPYRQTLEDKGEMKDRVVVSYELTLPQNIYPKAPGGKRLSLFGPERRGSKTFLPSFKSSQERP